MEEIEVLLEELSKLTGEGIGSIMDLGLKRSHAETELERAGEKKKAIKETIISCLCGEGEPYNKASSKVYTNQNYKNVTNEYMDAFYKANESKIKHIQKRDRKEAIEKILSIHQSLIKHQL
jgi:hypothetical protein